MHVVGLHPSSTGAPGGKETGQAVSHFVYRRGTFDKACADLLKRGFVLPYVEHWSEQTSKTRKAKGASKTRFTCPRCEANAWGKPDLLIDCGICKVGMEAQVA